MKNKMLRAVLVGVIALAATACSRVESGHVGIKVNLLGSEKGVSTQELTPGRYWIGVNEELYVFPTFTQNCQWTAAPVEGKGCADSSTDEAIRFQTSEGMKVWADVGIAFAVDPTKVSDIFQKFRKGIVEISDSYVRRIVQDAFIAAAAKYKVEYIYGEGKVQLLKDVNEIVTAKLKPAGINVEQVFLLGDIGVPQQVTEAINAKITATQKTLQRENEVAQVKAEADKAREQAKGEADAKLTLASAEAEAIALKGKAIRENPSVVQLNAIDKWDGKLPVYTGNSGPLPFIEVK